MLQQLFRNIPDVTKNLLLINAVMFLATFLFGSRGIDLGSILGMHYPSSTLFEPYQAVTYMFMHGGMLHIFFNMYALVLFGSRLESVWGPKRYLLFYFITGIGALVLHVLIAYFRLEDLYATIPAEELGRIKDIIATTGVEYLEQGGNFRDATLAQINATVNVPMVGASGAVFGILIGFAMLFPNTELMLIFIPIPIKAKYFIGFYVLMELYLGYQNNPYDNVAHFAHLGGALFGLIMVLIWKRNRNNFY